MLTSVKKGNSSNVWLNFLVLHNVQDFLQVMGLGYIIPKLQGRDSQQSYYVLFYTVKLSEIVHTKRDLLARN